MITPNYRGWIKEGSRWTAILDLIDRDVRSWAEDRIDNPEITRAGWDTPQIDIRWYTPNNIGRAIQIALGSFPKGGYRVAINISAWKDSESDRQRKWRTEEITAFPVPDDLRDFPNTKLTDGLLDAYTQVQKWKEDSLSEKSDLPSRPQELFTEELSSKEILGYKRP